MQAQTQRHRDTHPQINNKNTDKQTHPHTHRQTHAHTRTHTQTEGAQAHGDPEAQRHRGKEAQRHRGTEAQRHGDTDTWTHRHKGTQTHRNANTQTHNHTNLDTATARGLAPWVRTTSSIALHTHTHQKKTRLHHGIGHFGRFLKAACAWCCWRDKASKAATCAWRRPTHSWHVRTGGWVKGTKGPLSTRDSC